MEISISSLNPVLDGDLPHFFVTVSFREKSGEVWHSAGVTISLNKDDVKSFNEIKPMAIEKAKEYLRSIVA